jgi:hypothetical protein
MTEDINGDVHHKYYWHSMTEDVCRKYYWHSMMEDINEDVHRKHYWHNMMEDVKPVTCQKVKVHHYKIYAHVKAEERLELSTLMPKPNLRDAAHKEGDKTL